MDGWGNLNSGFCAPPRRALSDTFSPSTIRLKRASTIAELRQCHPCVTSVAKAVVGRGRATESSCLRRYDAASKMANWALPTKAKEPSR